MWSCKVLLNVEYAKKDDHSLTTQVIHADYVQKGATTYPLIVYVQGSVGESKN